MKKTNELSPFEFKDELIRMASSDADRMMLNAGRGNPNFLATAPRHAYLRLGDFALKESERSYSFLEGHFGGAPEKKDIVDRFDEYAMLHEGKDGIHFLQASAAFVNDHLGISKQDFLFEMTNAFLGCNYPTPPRMQTVAETIVKRYLQQELCNKSAAEASFDLFATEGGTAAMTYIFNTLKISGITKAGDKVAMLTPIFSPYLEIPVLPEFGMEIVHVRAKREDKWQVPASELKKLEDPKIKILCVVNPSNPPSVKMNEQTLADIASVVEKRKDLMIITDDVYATFSNNFESLFFRCPYNTLCVYSFSKYFGATGWRLGVMAINHENVFDNLVSKLDAATQKRLDKRYESLTPNPRSLRFIDRLVADSRAVALNHTAGISLPQQLQMTLFALSSLLDSHNVYRQAAKDLVHRRYNLLYQAISSTEIPLKNDPNLVGYYTLIDLEELARALYNDKFAAWILKNYSAADFLKRLAVETGVVLLPGKGFDTEHPSARVSLANLREIDYRNIGIAVRKILEEFDEQFNKKK